jgi:hypothetical protein
MNFDGEKYRQSQSERDGPDGPGIGLNLQDALKPRQTQCRQTKRGSPHCPFVIVHQGTTSVLKGMALLLNGLDGQCSSGQNSCTNEANHPHELRLASFAAFAACVLPLPDGSLRIRRRIGGHRHRYA